jgi:hypothetical protein
MDFRRIDREGPAKKTAHDTSLHPPPPYENPRNAGSDANFEMSRQGCTAMGVKLAALV